MQCQSTSNSDYKEYVQPCHQQDQTNHDQVKLSSTWNKRNSEFSESQVVKEAMLSKMTHVKKRRSILLGILMIKKGNENKMKTKSKWKNKWKKNVNEMNNQNQKENKMKKTWKTQWK